MVDTPQDKKSETASPQEKSCSASLRSAGAGAPKDGSLVYVLFQYSRSGRRQVVGFDCGSEAANTGAVLHHAIRNACSVIGECDKAGNLLAVRRQA